MPNYEEVIQQSQANIKSLSEKLKDLDQLHQDIKKLINQPEIFDSKYNQIVKLSEDYTNTLGAATKKYLDGNNTLFTAKLSELSDKTNEFKEEISRLVNTDFTKLFKDLQQVFIDKSREDLAFELKRFEKKSIDLQTKIDKLNKQIERLEEIDLEIHFDRLQKTLSEIFGAINSINLTLTYLTKDLASITQSIGNIETTINKNHQEITDLIDSFSKQTDSHLVKQDEKSKSNVELLTNKIQDLEQMNIMLKKDIKHNRIFQFTGVGIILVTLIYLFIKG